MRCVGYRQAWEFLEGAIDAATLRAQGIAATRQLAKRQLTWLRATPRRVRPVDVRDARGRVADPGRWAPPDRVACCYAIIYLPAAPELPARGTDA